MKEKFRYPYFAVYYNLNEYGLTFIHWVKVWTLRDRKRWDKTFVEATSIYTCKTEDEAILFVNGLYGEVLKKGEIL